MELLLLLGEDASCLTEYFLEAVDALLAQLLVECSELVGVCRYRFPLLLQELLQLLLVVLEGALYSASRLSVEDFCPCIGDGGNCPLVKGGRVSAGKGHVVTTTHPTPLAQSQGRYVIEDKCL